MSLTRGLFRPERRSTGPWGDSSIPSNGSLGMPVSGVTLNESLALSIPAVWACVRLLASAVATLPLKVYEGDGPTRREVDPPPVLVQPYEWISMQDWLTQVMVSLTLRGNFYGYVTRGGRLGMPVSVQPIPPDLVKVRLGEDGLPQYRVNGTPVDVDEILHIRNISSPGQLIGLNPIEYARVAMGMAAAADRWNANFFANSARADVAITVPGDLDPDETLAMAIAWKESHQGLGQAHLPAVLTGGASITQLTISPEDAQFLQTRQFQRSEIAMWFGIPPHKIGDVDRTTSWGTGIEQQERSFATDTLRDYLHRIEHALSALALPSTQDARFDMKERLRGDTLQRYTAYQIGRNGGWLSADDVRAEEELAPLPDGKGAIYLTPMNTAPAGAAPPEEGKPT